MKKVYRLEGLDCANCAAKIEQAVCALPGVEAATVDFATTKMSIEASESNMGSIEKEAKQIVKKLEPDVVVTENQKQQASSKNMYNLIRILVTFALLGIVLLWSPANPMIEGIGYGLIYLLIGGDVVKRAITNIFRGEVFDENFLMAIATIGAFFIGEYIEGVAVMLFYQVGELFQSYAVDQSRKSITSLLDIRPDYANLVTAEGTKKVDPEQIAVGDKIIVKPGEKIPLDGVILDGSSMLDTSALTGESVPRGVMVGDEVLSGCINKNGVLTVEVTKIFNESTVSKILDLVENATSKKAPSENFITKFARYYTPIVVLLAVLLAVIPSLFDPASFNEWLYRALTFLVISCPCALVISVPLSFFGGIGGASKMGVLVKGSNYLEILAQVKTIVFDKTGTLTKGTFEVQTIVPNGVTKEELLEATAYAESFSNHPIAMSIKEAYGQAIDEAQISAVEEVAGHGVIVTWQGKQVAAGNHKLMKQLGLVLPVVDEIGTVIFVAINGQYAGYLVIADELKADAAEAIAGLKQAGVTETVMLTGDNAVVGQAVGKRLGLDQVHTDLLPEDKVNQLEAIMANTADGKVAFVGDGMNDAPVLARADVGIAMGGVGSDAAIEAADIVIMNDEPSRIVSAMKIARKTLGIVKQNITFAIGVKVIVLIMGALGVASMGAAVFADVGVTVIAVLNAMRCLNVKKLQV